MRFAINQRVKYTTAALERLCGYGITNKDKILEHGTITDSFGGGDWMMVQWETCNGPVKADDLEAV